MRRRVVHARIRSRVVYGCFLIQKKYGLHPETKAMSTVVSEVLESLLNRLIEQGDLPSLNDDDADIKISEWLAEAPEDRGLDIPISSEGLNFGGIPPNEDQNPTDDLYTDNMEYDENHDPYDPDEPDEKSMAAGQEIVDSILKHIQAPSDAELFKEGDQEEPEAELPLADTPPWEQEGVRALETIKEEVRKDDEVALTYADADRDCQLAFQVVYSQIPKELWGTSRADQLIQQVRPQIARYLEAGF